MKFNKNKRMFLAMYTAMMSAVMLTGFASSTEAQEQSAVESEVSTEAAEQEETLDDTQFAEGTDTEWGVSQEVIDVQSGMIENVKIAAVEAKIAYEAKLEEERRAAEEAERIAREKAEAEAAAAAQAEAEAAQQAADTTKSEPTTQMKVKDKDKSAAGLPDDQISVDPSTEKSTDGLPDDKVMWVNGETSGTYLGTFWITAYCPCPICCGEYSNMDNPTTASGAPAVEGVTCAAPSNFAFGTELIVDGHTYTVQDRGGAINGNHLDIYFSNHQAALNFATGYYDVYVK